MTRFALAAPLAVLLLAGCAQTRQIATFTAADAGNADSMANRAAASGDPQAGARAPCYAAWANLAGGVANLPQGSIGLFTGVEAGLEVQSTLQLPPCQQIAGQVLLWALRKAPIGGNLVP